MRAGFSTGLNFGAFDFKADNIEIIPCQCLVSIERFRRYVLPLEVIMVMIRDRTKLKDFETLSLIKNIPVVLRQEFVVYASKQVVFGLDAFL